MGVESQTLTASCRGVNPAGWYKVSILVWSELVYLVSRRRTVLAFCIYMLILLLLGALFDLLLDAGIGRESKGQLMSGLSRFVLAQEALFGRTAAHDIANLMFRLPWALWAFQLSCFLWYPAISALISADMLTQDIHSGSIRFLLTRVSPSVVLWSRVIAHLLCYVFLHFLSLLGVLVVVIYAGGRFYQISPWEALFLYELAAIPFLITCVALAAVASLISKRPVNAVLWVNLLWVAALVVVFFLRYLSPFNPSLVAGVVFPTTLLVWQSSAGYLIWGGVLLVVGRYVLYRRDL